jgi:hypothetical protein
MPDYPAFEQATERLRSFLKSEGLPEDIVWVNPEDVALIDGRFYVRLLERSIARDRAMAKEGTS